jgi:general secretion pathway protein E
VNSILTQAVRARASDIHIEPFERELKVRYRIDGILYNTLTPPRRLQAAISSRIKVMANLNIAERRLPQDGRIRIRVGEKDVDIRVSVVPTAYGERIVLRLLDKTSVLLGLEEIGMAEAARRHWPDSGQPQDRPDVRERTAVDSTPGSGCHHGRRDSRSRNR